MTQPMQAPPPAPPEDDDDDPIKKLHDQAVEAKLDFKRRVQKGGLSTDQIATELDGTVMAIQVETVVTLAMLRDWLIEYVDERIDALTEESQIIAEDAEKIVGLADGTLLLIAECRASGGSALSPDARKSLDALEALAKEVREITEAAAVGDDEDEDEEGDEDGDDGEA
jgi:uncharacterized protein YicC (UPF0701 family)